VPAPPALNAPSPSQPGGSERTNDHGKGASTKPDKHQKLKQDLQNLLDNIHKLQDELKKAPDSLKPALEHAIEIAQQRYQDAINNLDGGD
jgi:predicted  nucleic acid-binding Zn-ribbon protein